MTYLDERVQFPGRALTPENIAAHAARERFLNGFYLKEIYYPHKFIVPRHWHTNASFFLVLAGCCLEVHGHKRWECAPLNVGLVPRGETHEERMEHGAVRSFIFEIQPSWLNRLSECSVDLDAPKKFDQGPVSWTLMKIYREHRLMDDVTPLSIESLAVELAVNINACASLPQANAPSWLRQTRDLLHDCFARRLTLEAIATSAGVHPVHLVTVFRREYGCTIGDYVRRLRVEFSCRELINSRTPIAEIALAAGFCDQSHMSKTFKHLTGISPAQFRKTVPSI